MLKENVIRNFDNGTIEYDDLVKRIEKLTLEGYDVFIGTDSQVIKTKLSIVTCVCLYKNGTGKSQIFYVKNRLPAKNYPTLRSRMLFEAYKSLEAALDVDPYAAGRLTVHLDIGSDFKKCKTAKFKKELQILVRSQGLGCEVKPNSWASSAVADRFTKT